MIAYRSVLQLRRTRPTRPRHSLAALSFLGLSCSLVGPCQSHAQCNYEATPIQPQPCPIFGILPAQPRGLSSIGHVAGWYQDCSLQDDVAYFWTPALGMVDIPFPPGSIRRHAEDINSAGRIVGSVDLPNDGLAELAFVYENGTLTNLGAMPGGNISEAVAVNENGQVVGQAWNFITGDPPFTPFLWQDGVMTFLNLPFGPKAKATDINDHGQIVGWMGQADIFDSHAYIWQDGDVNDLGLPPGAFACTATAINNAGQVVVFALFQDDKSSPVLICSFLWDDGQWINLGILPGYDRCFALDLNEAGQVIGYCSQSAQPNFVDSFLWQDGAMMRLDDLVVTETATVSFPCRINDAGQIASGSSFQMDPAVLLLNAINQPPGDLDHDCAVGIDDFLSLLAAWGPCPLIGPCTGDVDGDGLVGIVDFLALLANWTS